MKQEYTIDELKLIAIELDSPQGNLKIARQNVISHIETTGSFPTAQCPRCGFEVQIEPDVTHAGNQPVPLLCRNPGCRCYGFLV
jgi:hypothetical protein